jgi:hypothetical protein
MPAEPSSLIDIKIKPRLEYDHGPNQGVMDLSSGKMFIHDPLDSTIIQQSVFLEILFR